MGAIRWRTRCASREAAKRATPPCISEVCTDERRHGPARVHETQYTAKFRKHSSPKSPAHSTSRSTTMTVCRSSGAPGRTGSLPCLDRRSGICGAPWYRSSTQSLWCLFSTILCRRRWNSCKTCSSSSTGSRPFPSRLLKCPRSTPRTSLCARFCVLRSWQNSWWKCRRSSPFL